MSLTEALMAFTTLRSPPVSVRHAVTYEGMSGSEKNIGSQGMDSDTPSLNLYASHSPYAGKEDAL